jgi:cytochrome bd ubiquinol oxidase subunit I
MFGLSVLDMARLQFAVTTSLHWLFVLVTLGLVTHLVILQTRWLITGKAEYAQLTRYWGQLYLINYALGIGTGLVMEFQFGLNWSGLSELVGNVIGAPLALETIIVFVLESTFLGLWIFGWHVLPRWLHTTLIWLVALTAYASAFFVLAANAFLQHPVGYAETDGVVRLTDFGALLRNPTFVQALPHVIGAALLAGSGLMAGISAMHLLRRRGPERYALFRRSLRQALWVAWPATGLSIAFGFGQFGVISDYQPTKLRDDALADAGYSSADLPPDWIGVNLGLMISIGFILALGVSLLLPLLFRDWLIRLKLPLLVIIAATPLPFVAAVAGWLFREVGRQPWAVYGMLRTEDAVSHLSPGTVAASLVGFTALLAILAVADWWLIARYAARGPENVPLGAPPPDPLTLAPIPHEQGALA